MGTNYSAVIPAQVAVRFPGRRCSGQVSDTVPTYYTKTMPIATILAEVDADIPTNTSGFSGTKWFHEAALALFNVGNGTPTNQAALDALALRIAADWVQWQSVSFDKIYEGIIAPVPTGLHDLIEFVYEIDDVYTRVISAPYNGEPEEMMHHDPANAECRDTGSLVVAKTPCWEGYGPPFTCSGGRATATRYLYCLVDGRVTQTYVSTDQVQ